MDELTPCPGCPELRLDCACVTDISQMPLADIKAVFADECLDHPTCTHVGDHPLSIDPIVTANGGEAAEALLGIVLAAAFTALLLWRLTS